jgi:predicted membrane protein
VNPEDPPRFQPSEEDVKLWNKQSFDYAADGTKQLITIATGVITATAIFVKDLATFAARVATVFGWLALFISIVYGALVLMGLAGNSRRAAQGRVKTPELEDDILDKQKWQVLSFLVGIVIVIISGCIAVWSHPSNDKPIVNYVQSSLGQVNQIQPGTQSQATPTQPNNPPCAAKDGQAPTQGTNHHRTCCCARRRHLSSQPQPSSSTAPAPPQ